MRSGPLRGLIIGLLLGLAAGALPVAAARARLDVLQGGAIRAAQDCA
jgi:F0F1-type ATP synthase assembly protein I